MHENTPQHLASSSFKEGLAPRLRAGRARAFMLGLLTFTFAFTGVHHAYAATIYSQTDNTGSITGGQTITTGATIWASTIDYSGATTYYAHYTIKTDDPGSNYSLSFLDSTNTYACAYVATPQNVTTSYQTFDTQLYLVSSNSSHCTGTTYIPQWTTGTHTTAHTTILADSSNTYGYAIITTGAIYNPNTQTRIDTVTPPDGALIATSTGATLGLTGYLNSTDLASSTVATMAFYRNSDMQAAVSSPSLITTTLTFPISSSGALSFSTTTPLLREGTYTLTTSLTKPQYSILGFNFFTTTIAATTTNFTVGTTTAWDNFQTQSITNIQNTINTFATSTCALNFTSFNLGDCVLSFVWPGPGAFDQFKTVTLANSAPFAYAYQMPTIINAVFNSPLAASSTITMNLPAPFGAVTIFSQALLTAVPFAAALKIILTAVMWFMGAFVIYRKILGTHDHISHI